MKTAGLDRALRALDPYLGDLLLCGAWAWYLYRRCLAAPRPIPEDFTRDLDCIGHERLPMRGTPLFDRLTDNDFEWVPRGEATPPVAHFAWPNRNKPEVEVEFLTAARGDGSRRIVELQPGLTAQALRNLEILADSPVTLLIDDHSPMAGELEFRGSIQLPNVGHFVIQKALIHLKRDREEQVKDIFYVVELLDHENGLSTRSLEDTLAADAKWTSGVDRLVEVLEKRSGERPFLTAVAEQYPIEKRPPTTYLEREITTWLAKLQDGRREGAAPNESQ